MKKLQFTFSMFVCTAFLLSTSLPTSSIQHTGSSNNTTMNCQTEALAIADATTDVTFGSASDWWQTFGSAMISCMRRKTY